MRYFVKLKINLMLIGIVCVGWIGTSPAKAVKGQSVLYVKADATGAFNGTTWADAYNDLQDALAITVAGDQIWVAAGTYTPGGPGDRTATFQLKSGVEIFGGFVGTEVSLSERDPATNLTVLSGDLNSDDIEVLESEELTSESTRSDNSYHVVTGSGADETAVLDGFVITGGNANGSGHSNGGGMINVWKAAGGSGRGVPIPAIPANPILVNCTFHRNSASRNGGGVYNEAGKLTFIDCVFSENHVNDSSFDDGGGGMYNERGNLTLRYCLFIENTAAGNGAGLYNNNANATITDTVFDRNVVVGSADSHTGGGIQNTSSDPMIVNCTFTQNSAPYGGGIWNWGAPYPTILNCVFKRNKAVHAGDGAGGGIQNWGGGTNATVTNCTFSENTAVDVGAGLGANAGSTAIVTNCIFWGNSTRNNANEQIGGVGGDPTIVTYSCVQGGKSGEGNIDADPLFADPENGNFRLKSQAGRLDPISGNWTQDDVTSPCIDAGDPMNPIGLEPFPNGGFINMGAYGGTSEASKTYFGEPVSETIVAGDINGDGQVNRADLEIMVLHWTDDVPLPLP